MVNKLMTHVGEAAGYALVIGFCYAVWAPLAMLAGGLLLIVWANTRAVKRAGRSGRVAASAVAAFTSALQAWREHRDELAERRAA